jgi:hypothetical protein
MTVLTEPYRADTRIGSRRALEKGTNESLREHGSEIREQRVRAQRVVEHTDPANVYWGVQEQARTV